MYATYILKPQWLRCFKSSSTTNFHLPNQWLLSLKSRKRVSLKQRSVFFSDILHGTYAIFSWTL